MNHVESKIIEIIKEKVSIQGEEVSLDARFTNDLGLDSLDAVELTMDFEKEFEITIPDEEAEQIQRIRQAIEVVKMKLQT